MGAMSADIGDKPEEELTNEERLAWLRKRGVIVEEPATRRQDGKKGAAFKYVKIPVDGSLACEQLEGSAVDGDALLGILGPGFAGGDVSDEALQAQIDKMGQAVSLAALRSVVAKGGAETFRLAVPTDANGREGVYAYLDEASDLKGLPRNERATALAHRCGFPESCVLCGDIYVGRQKWKGSVVQNVDFNVVELEASCLWQRRAVTENLEFQKSTMPEEHAAAQAVGLPNPESSGTGDGYSWKDVGEEVEVFVQMDKGVTKKDIKVEFKRQELRVLKPVSLTLKLFRPVDVDGCNWTLGDGQIAITMEKAVGAPWPQLLA